MSAIPQIRVRESKALATGEPGSDHPLQLLREAIDRLNSSNGELPDQAQVADLLAEAREALTRAGVIARAVTQCEEFLREAQFDKAFQALDAGLLAYPDDPALVVRRRDVEAQQRAFHAAAAVGTALEEAQFLLDQDRPDLAAHSLKEKAAEFPGQPALASRLEAIEALLPQWEQNRHIQAALGRVAALEQLQQWQAALTILDEALRSYPASAELTGAVRQVRRQLADHERRNKLARRLELIAQKIAAQSWRQAHTLLENTQGEFPGAPELQPLRREVDAGLRRSECEAIAAEVRQSLADGEPEQAEQFLRRGLDHLGPEPALEALRQELESESRYRQDLRTAQIHFGRRQFEEAERVLAALVAPNRPEAQVLLDAVRQARAVTEEENFCEQGREKALKLMQQQQFAQAADLLRNLLALFPGNPILERDLTAAQAALDQGFPEVAAAIDEEASSPPIPALLPNAEPCPADLAPARGTASSRVRRAAIAGTASLALVSAGGAAWRLSRNPAPVSRPAFMPAVSNLPATARVAVTQPTPTPPTATPPASVEPTAQQPPARPGTPPGKASTKPETPPAKLLRSFVPPTEKPAPVHAPSPALPLPPGTAVNVSAEAVTDLPVELVKPVNTTAPPAAPPQPASTPAPKPSIPVGGKLQEAELIERTLPTYPSLARRRAVFGLVKILAVIDEHGAVKNVKILSGDPVLAGAAKTAVEKWKYNPATLNGQPIASTVAIQIVFGDPKK
jgi:protein TonB